MGYMKFPPYWRTQVFKIEVSASVSFLAILLPPLSLFGSRFISRAVKTESLLPRYFFPPKPNGNACYAGYVDPEYICIHMKQGIYKFHEEKDDI